MPRRKKNPEQDGADQNQASQVQTGTPEQEPGYMEQETAASGPLPDTAEPVEEIIPEQTGTEQPETPTPPEIPLSVRISSLEMDGDTRAFAIAEYGDLTINRVRIKEDGYGTLSVNMPKYRSPEGWRDTCRFTTTEARNRLTSTVLDAYQQKLTQLQGVSQEKTAADVQATGDGQVDAQTADESQAPDRGVEPTDASDMDEPEQGGFGMSMSQ